MHEHSSVQQWGSTSVYLITLFATVHHVTIVKSLFLTTYMTKRGGSFDAWKKDFDNVGAVSFFKPRLSIPCTWCYKTSNKAPACLWFYAPFSLRRQNSPVTDNFVGVSGYPSPLFSVLRDITLLSWFGGTVCEVDNGGNSTGGGCESNEVWKI